MKKIYSNVQPNVLLHMVNKYLDITYERNDLSPDEEYLQVSTFKLEEDKTFRPHKHILNVRETTITQESWIVIRGKVKVFYYDLDDTLLSTEILDEGDCTITFRGGHTYQALREGTTIYEVKTGPYYGQTKDKEFINNKGETQ